LKNKKFEENKKEKKKGRKSRSSMADVVTNFRCLEMLRNVPWDCINEPEKDDFVDTHRLRYKVFLAAYPADRMGLKQIIGSGVYA
jgi:hypothetical protein